MDTIHLSKRNLKTLRAYFLLLVSLFLLDIISCSPKESGWFQVLDSEHAGNIFFSEVVNENHLIYVSVEKKHDEGSGIKVCLIDSTFSIENEIYFDSLQLNASSQICSYNDSLLVIAARKKHLIRLNRIKIKETPVTAAMDSISHVRLIGDSLNRYYAFDTHLLVLRKDCSLQSEIVIKDVLPEVLVKNFQNNLVLLTDSAAVVDSTEDRFLKNKFYYELEHKTIISEFDINFDVVLSARIAGDRAGTIIPVRSGSILVTKLESKNKNVPSSLLFRGFDKEYDLVWIKKHELIEFASRFMKYFDNKIWLVGTIDNEIRVIQFDKYGDYKTVNTLANKGDEKIGVVEVIDKHLLIAGTLQTYIGQKKATETSSILVPIFSHKVFCIKLDSDSEEVWKIFKDTDGVSQLNCITQTPSGNYISGGFTHIKNDLIQKEVLIKISGDGKID